MPSVKKILHFLSSAMLSAVGVVILGYGMSVEWAQSSMECSPTHIDRFNGSAEVTLGLFNGDEQKWSCPLFNTGPLRFNVMEELGKVEGAPVILHGLVISLICIAMIGSAGSILVTLYNSVSNPYETYLGPVGLYGCSGISASLAFLGMILFVVNVFGLSVAQAIVLADEVATLRGEKAYLSVGFYLVIPYIVVNLLAILVVYLYVHAAYTHRREQEKPTEDAPKEIMMY